MAVIAALALGLTPVGAARAQETHCAECRGPTTIIIGDRRETVILKMGSEPLRAHSFRTPLGPSFELLEFRHGLSDVRVGLLFNRVLWVEVRDGSLLDLFQ